MSFKTDGASRMSSAIDPLLQPGERLIVGAPCEVEDPVASSGFLPYASQAMSALQLVGDAVASAQGLSSACFLGISEERVLCVRESGETLIDLRRGKVVAQKWSHRRLRLVVEIDGQLIAFSFMPEWREEAESLAASLGANV